MEAPDGVPAEVKIKVLAPELFGFGGLAEVEEQSPVWEAEGVLPAASVPARLEALAWVRVVKHGVG